jgi:hypothetical protein
MLGARRFDEASALQAIHAPAVGEMPNHYQRCTEIHVTAT